MNASMTMLWCAYDEEKWILRSFHSLENDGKRQSIILERQRTTKFSITGIGISSDTLSTYKKQKHNKMWSVKSATYRTVLKYLYKSKNGGVIDT